MRKKFAWFEASRSWKISAEKFSQFSSFEKKFWNRLILQQLFCVHFYSTKSVITCLTWTVVWLCIVPWHFSRFQWDETKGKRIKEWRSGKSGKKISQQFFLSWNWDEERLKRRFPSHFLLDFHSWIHHCRFCSSSPSPHKKKIEKIKNKTFYWMEKMERKKRWNLQTIVSQSEKDFPSDEHTKVYSNAKRMKSELKLKPTLSCFSSPFDHNKFFVINFSLLIFQIHKIQNIPTTHKWHNKNI